jgi:hypothetical protein
LTRRAATAISIASGRFRRETKGVYRDTSTVVDEHDRAVGAILIGEAIVDECERTWQRVQDETTATPKQRWRAIGALHDTFPDIWRHLDRARRVLASRGIHTAGYDDLRPQARRAASNPGLDGSEAFDAAALDDVRRGIAELKLALPGADWDGIEARTQGLVRVPLPRRARQRITFAGSLAAFVIATLAWTFSMLPHSEARAAGTMAGDLRLVTEERRLHIIQRESDLGGRCLPAPAHELVQLLVQDDQRLKATMFSIGYLLHCGADPVVVHWMTAPGRHH